MDGVVGSEHRAGTDGTPRNLWRTRIGSLEHHGDHIRATLDAPLPAAADITAAAVADLSLTEGSRVWASVKATETHAYPA